MGKNQQYKAMQRARVGATSAGTDDIDDGMVDGSFHTPEWHAARLASLKTSHTVTWEEFKRKQKHLRRSFDSSSSSEPSSSDDEERESRKSRSKSKKRKKAKKHKSRSKHSTNDDDETGGPLPLSSFFESLKS